MSLEENAAFYKEVGALLTSWGWDDFINWWPRWATRTNSGTIKMPQGQNINTLNDPGVQPLDAMFFTPDVQLRNSRQLDPGDISDHKVWLVKGTLVEA